VTSTDNGRTIHLAVGERFLLELGSGLDWAVTGIDPTIVARVTGVTVIRGAQGLYEAQANGTATLTATGSPICPATGACPMYRLAFRLTIVVG